MTFRGFLSRADLGLRPPRSRSLNITPSGSTKHYGGGPVGIPLDLSGHSRCIQVWRGWQTFHMGSRGWADIAYSLGVCQHGYVLAGRGRGVRTAANGTNTGNQVSHAICAIIGGGEVPTVDLLDALDVAHAELGGGHLRKHKDWKNTACAGVHLDDYQLGSRSGGFPVVPAPTPGPAPAPAPGPALNDMGNSLRLKPDGDWAGKTQARLEESLLRTGGALTIRGVISFVRVGGLRRPRMVEASARALQARLNHVATQHGLSFRRNGRPGLDIDGDLGDRSVRCLQWIVGTGQDGDAGPDTATALQNVLNAREL